MVGGGTDYTNYLKGFSSDSIIKKFFDFDKIGEDFHSSSETHLTTNPTRARNGNWHNLITQLCL